MCSASESAYDNVPIYDYQRITGMPSSLEARERKPVRIFDGSEVRSSEYFIPNITSLVEAPDINKSLFSYSGSTFGTVEGFTGTQRYVEDRHDGSVNVVVPVHRRHDCFHSRPVEYIRHDVESRQMPLGLYQYASENSSITTGNSDDPIRVFADGVGDTKPRMAAVILAQRLVEVVKENVEHPDICLDDDGELSFDLRLRNGRLLMAELSVHGNIVGSLYDENDQFLEEVSTEEKFIEQINN